MALRGTLLPVLALALSFVAVELIEGVSGTETSFVRRRLAGHEPLGASAWHSPGPTRCPIPCWGLLPNCCENKSTPGVYLCINTQIDLGNCGTCGNNCFANGLTPGVACCRGTCTNTMNDPNNCGFCGNRCPWSDKCHMGMCNYAG